MADTTTPLLGLLLMETGGDSNAWGTNLNQQVITLIENAIAGVATVPVTGGSYSLVAAEARAAVVVLTGTLTADQTIVVPNTTKKYSFNNQCSGNFFVLVKTASGAAVNAPAGKQTDIICYGSNIVLRADQEKVGEFFYHAGTAAPAGSFECTNATAIRASVVDLFGVIGTTWGVGNGSTTFNLPPGNDTGRYLRSRTSTLTVGTLQSNQNKSHTHTGSGTATGSTDNPGNHTHANTIGFSDPGHSHSYAAPQNTGLAGSISLNDRMPVQTFTTGASATGISVGITNAAAGAHTHVVTSPYSFTTSTGSADGTEARPESLVGILCIRY